MRDFPYYRCSWTDPYRFGGERICSNSQVRADSLEAAIWDRVCGILRNPEKMEEALGRDDGSQASSLQENIDTLRSQRQKLEHGIERLMEIKGKRLAI